MRHSVVYAITTGVVHFEKPGTRTRSRGHGAGGVTLCGMRFVPRSSMYSRAPEAAKVCPTSCKDCVRAAMATT